MNRVVKTSVVVGLLGCLGYMPIASAAGTLYGSVRSGVIVKDGSDMDAQVDLGAVDAGDLGSGDRLYSRFGVKASHELDNGMMAGLVFEKRLDNFRTRHQNVWLGFDKGQITLGQQGSPYHSAVGWDGTNFTGGNFAMSGGSRKNGISFASDLGGPFNFKALLMDDNSVEIEDEEGKKKKTGYGKGLDAFELSGSLAAGGVTINAGYADNDMHTLVGASAGGSFSNLGWEIGFETKNPDMSGAEDTNRAGFFVDYDVTKTGAVYFYYERESGAGDGTAWVTGYSHGLGSGVKVIGEHRDHDAKGTTSILAVVVGF